MVKVWWFISHTETQLDAPAETWWTWDWVNTVTYLQEINVNVLWSYTISFEKWCTSWGSTSPSYATDWVYKLFVNDEEVKVFETQKWTNHATESYTFTIDKPSKITYRVQYFYNPRNNPYNIWYNTSNLLIVSNQIWKENNNKKELPQEEKALWEKMTATLFGRHIDWERFTD